MESGIYPNISHDKYHSMTDIVSNSYLGRLDKCPANAKIPMPDSPALSFGRAYHSFILDGQKSFDRDFVVIPEDAPKAPSSAQIKVKKPSDETIAAIKWWFDFNNLNDKKTILQKEDYESSSRLRGVLK